MSHDWEESTEPLPGDFDERSIGVDLARVEAPKTNATLSPEAALASLWPAERRDDGAPDLVVFEPSTRGLKERIAALGYRVRVAASGVDVMSLVAARPTAAVLCGPMQDGERRRLLTAALRVRFPQVPVVYVTTHAGTSEGVHGAIREGAQAVMQWPLPADEQIHACLGGYLRRGAAPSPAQPEAARAPQAVELPPTQVFEREAVVAARQGALPSPPPTLALDPPPRDLERGEWELPPTERSGAQAPAQAKPDPRTEIRALLSAIAPFVWSLHDAADWAETQAKLGDPQAASHVQSLRALGNILEQLQARLDEVKRQRR